MGQIQPTSVFQAKFQSKLVFPFASRDSIRCHQNIYYNIIIYLAYTYNIFFYKYNPCLYLNSKMQSQFLSKIPLGPFSAGNMTTALIYTGYVVIVWPHCLASSSSLPFLFFGSSWFFCLVFLRSYTYNFCLFLVFTFLLLIYFFSFYLLYVVMLPPSHMVWKKTACKSGSLDKRGLPFGLETYFILALLPNAN